MYMQNQNVLCSDYHAEQLYFCSFVISHMVLGECS